MKKYEDLVASAVEATSPEYGFGKWPGVTGSKSLPVDDGGLVDGVKEIFWLNIFTPRTADDLGYDRLFTAPAWHVEELETGHILLVAADNPVEPAEEWKGAEERITEHLGIEQ